MTEQRDEKMELMYELVLGYWIIFFIAIVIGALYLGLILFKTLG